MAGHFRRLVFITFKDSLFCLCLLFLCYNPYTDFPDRWRIGVIYTAFVLYLLIPRILKYGTDEDFFSSFETDEVSRQKETFVAALSHDLKTPALSQISSIQMLLNENFGSLNTEQKTMLKATLNSCKYMKDLIFTLLATYKFNNGSTPLKFAEFDIQELITECTEETKSLTFEGRTKIEVSMQAASDKNVYADRVQIKRVIMNLLANAISYAYKNSVIKINVVNEKGFLRFYIENSGEYMDKEIIKNLFKKYASFSSKYKKAGIGLGLYLSSKIIEAHGGNIKAESYRDESKNIFSFYIPSSKPDEGGENQKQSRVTF